MNNDRFKFRVWDTIEKTYDYKFPYNQLGVFYMREDGCLCSDFGNTVRPEFKQDRFTIEQCTGLKDKNGKLVYENDVLWIEQYGIRGTVQFCVEKGCWRVYYNDSFMNFIGLDISKSVIWGNIHDKQGE